MKTNNRSLVVITAALMLLGAGCATQPNQTTNDDSMMENTTEQSDTMMKKDESKNDNAMMEDKKDPAMIKTDDVMMDVAAGYYEDYSADKLARATNGKVVLFFKAGWCPTCKTFDTDTTARLKEIPKDVNILRVNYDTATELKQKYGVTYQHTFVQVDQNGNLLKKWSGSNSLSSFLKSLNG